MVQATNEKAADEPVKGNGNKPEAKLNDAKAEDEQDLSEEDRSLKEDLETLVERLQEPDASLYPAVLNQLKDLIRTSTSSMTAVPKPLKFLRPHYDELVHVYESWEAGPVKIQMADILSVLGMTYSDDSKRDALKYRLAGVTEDPGSWGHEYVRHLAAEIGEEYNHRRQLWDDAAGQESSMDAEQDNSDLFNLAREIVPFFLTHNAEADAVDLMMEIEIADELPRYVDAETYQRVCLYMLSCVKLLPFPDDVDLLRVVYNVYMQHSKLLEAFDCAIQLDDTDLQQNVFDAAEDPAVKKQICLVAARQQVPLATDDENLAECLRNTNISGFYHNLLNDLDIAKPKDAEDVYKTHLENSRLGVPSGVDTAKQNLAKSFANALINVGSGADNLVLTEDDSRSWIYKLQGPGMLSTTASIGLLHLWDVEMGLSEIDKYLYASEESIKAGALLGVAISNIGVRNEADPAIAVLSEYLENKTPSLRNSAIFGLGLAYTGTGRQDVSEPLLATLSNTDYNMETVSLAALSVGLIHVGKADSETVGTILQTMMERESSDLDSKWSIFMILGLALLYVGSGDEADATIETLRAIEHPISKSAQVLVDMCSFAGSGNVLKIQQMLHHCSEYLEDKTDGEEEGKSDSFYQSLATIGVALIAIGEDVGSEMVLRQFNHLMHYGEGAIRKAVPLALGLLHASNPDVKVFDTLSRMSHDADIDVALSAIFAMGLVGAGTNNARLAQLLRQLASYYSREPNALFLVRVAQGLLHCGKGTISLDPYSTDGQILNKRSLGGLLLVLLSLLDARSLVVADNHYLLYGLALSMQPRMLYTVTEDLQPLSVSVRVGQAVDVVGQAGRPKTITGWATQTTPVLLHHGERAELAAEEYLPVASAMEGLVILRKNPDYMET